MKKFFQVYMLAVLCIIVLSSCKSTVPESSTPEVIVTTTETTVTEITTTEESLPPMLANVNLLTGISNLDASAYNKRPVAVMINNNRQSLPQYGIEAADVIFEIPVEGGITRLMAVYSDYNKIPNVCSVRSCRYYFPLIANGIDAVYIHWGSDQSIALDTLNSLGITHLDGGEVGGPVFGRDAERRKTYSLEHTGYLNGSELAKAFASGAYRTDLKEGYNKTILTFNSENSSVLPQGTACTNAVINFSKAYYSTFTYDEATMTYKKQHSGNAHIDSSTGNQLAFTNVIILKTNISLLNAGELLNIDLSSGTGQYISNGICEDINWSKLDENSSFILTKADGTPLSVNAGKSYIGIIGYDKAVSIQ